MPFSALVPTAVFVSGTGTNLQAVIDSARRGDLPLDIRIVISNRPDAYAIERARSAGIATAIVPWNRAAESRASYAIRLAECVKESGARLVLLLGWMHVLSKEFLEVGFAGVLNLHPALLPDDPSADVAHLPDGSSVPAFRGANALRDALAAGAPVTGATLIEVTADVDRGPVLARRVLALQPGEDEAVALERMHAVERDVVHDGVLRWIERTWEPALRR